MRYFQGLQQIDRIAPRKIDVTRQTAKKSEILFESLEFV